jgi:ABC-type polysaccharide transport system permease subunit
LNYLKDLNEENKVNRTKISIQQKVKYGMHMALLVLIHIYVFWYVPIRGNMALYGSPKCDKSKEKYYGCKDFHKNPTLKFFYLVLCGYLFLSALQIKFGIPIRKIPSSVL